MPDGIPHDDIVDPQRSRIMRAVRAKDTKPEIAVRRIAHGLGYRFRLHAADLPGRPDMVFRSRRKVIFVHGCFWHRHDCGRGTTPRTRTEWWERKLAANVRRDAAAQERLSAIGWESIVIWECQSSDPAAVTSTVVAFLSKNAEDLPSGDLRRASTPCIRIGLREAGPETHHQGTNSMKRTSSGKRSTTRPPKIGHAATPASRPTRRPKATAQATTTPEAVPVERRQMPGDLPSRYAATTDLENGIVTIRHHDRTASVRMRSYASVVGVLSMIEANDGRISAGATLEISDPFTGRRASISPTSLSDVGEALVALCVEVAEPTETDAPASPPTPVSPSIGTVDGKAPSSKTPTASRTVAKAPAAAAGGRRRAAGAKAAAAAEGFPDWFLDTLEAKYVSGSGAFVLVRTLLSVDPQRNRVVLGRWGEAEGQRTPGYEVLYEGRHLGWVIADKPKSFILTGIPGGDDDPVPQRIMIGVLSRLDFSIRPSLPENA